MFAEKDVDRILQPASTRANDIKTLNLDALAKDATALLMGEESRLADALAGLAGGSGGARPKVNVGFDDQVRLSFYKFQTAEMTN